MNLSIEEDLDRIFREVSLLEKKLENRMNGNNQIIEIKNDKGIFSESSIISSTDEDFQTPVSRIKVLGVGGAGCNTVSNLYDIFKNSDVIDVYAINTDAYQLRRSRANYRVLIGKKTCKGYGAGNDPKRGEEAIRESLEDIKNIIEDTDILFVTCGLGGGTGSGAAPVIIETAKEMGILTVAICTLPFSSEGKKKFENAKEALIKIMDHADTYIFIPNDKLLEIAPKMSILAAFKLADSVLVTAIRAITDMALKSGAINVDFADVLTVLRGGKTTVIGIGEADTSIENRGIAAVQKALTNPLLDVDISTAKRALINISGDPNIGVVDVNSILAYVNSRISSDEEIIWGFFPDKELNNLIRVTVILTGIDPIVDPEMIDEIFFAKKKTELMEIPQVNV